MAAATFIVVSPQHGVRREKLVVAPSIRRVRPFQFLLAFFIVWVVVLLAASGLRPAKVDFYSYLAFGDVERFTCWLLLPALWLIVVEHRPISAALHPVDRRSVRWTIIAATSLGILLLLGMKLTRGQWHAIPAGHSTLEYLAAIISIGLLAVGEEFVFRGVVLSGLTKRGWAFWIANIVVAIAFMFSHWPGWLMFGGMPATALITASLRVLFFGLLMGGLVRLEGGLVAAISMHWLNDVLAGTLF